MTTKDIPGYSTMEIPSGVERPFHVGIQQGEIFASLENRRRPDGRSMSLKDYDKLFSAESLSKQELSGGEVRDFIYSALVMGAMLDKLPIDFEPQDVALWIDISDPQQISKPFSEMLRQVMVRFNQQLERAKNAQAPLTMTEVGPKKENPTLQP
jgi:hypothetical protein